MHIHILGICGTFMAGLAIIAKQSGFQVSGTDKQFYPPMSDLLQQHDIDLDQGYDRLHQPNADIIIVGNALSRGMPVIEEILNSKKFYISGPQWLAENILKHKQVIAIAGTHGKTTTSSILTWILQQNGVDAGYLIGGKAQHLESSASIGNSDIFVIEADEYDSAFFDKRSKFIHYHPRTLVINNLEYDHADIFPDLAAIQTQFHHLIRTVLQQGMIIYPQDDHNIQAVIDKGCWSPTAKLCFGEQLNHDSQWQAQLLTQDGSQFNVYFQQQLIGTVNWELIGQHNVNNALASIAAAYQADIAPTDAIAAINQFPGVKRRLEKIKQIGSTHIYDDFAHHPTAIKTTTAGLRAKISTQETIILIIELASNSMQAGVHHNQLIPAVVDANLTIWYAKQSVSNDLQTELITPNNCYLAHDLTDINTLLAQQQTANNHIVIMSNADSKPISQSIITSLTARDH